MELTPNISDVVKYQLPENVRTASNSQFVAFIQHYYDWLVQNGQPTEFIQNIMQYRDIDMMSPAFMQHLSQTILSAIPATTTANRNMIAKNLASFLDSKGTLASFEFIMNAIYGQQMEIEWKTSKLFRPSANAYTRTATVPVESVSPWIKIEGSTLTQLSPTPATGIIESNTTIVINGEEVNILTLRPDSVVGEFTNEGAVQVLHNDINRNWHQVQQYYTPISLIGNGLTFIESAGQVIQYDNLIVRQINSDFRAVVVNLLSRTTGVGQTKIILNLTSITGTFNPSSAFDLYVIPSSVEATHYTKANFETGTVSSSIADVNITNLGSLYSPGDTITFIDGDGAYADAHVSDTTVGSVDSTMILSKGYGYSIGDALQVVDEGDTGTGFSAVVSSLDGIGASIYPHSMLNSISILSGGVGYKVNDEFFIPGGTPEEGSPSARARVTSVNSSWYFDSIRLDASGSGYPTYTTFKLINTATTSIISGFDAAALYDNNGGISSITMTSRPTISANALAIIANGYGATAHSTLSTGSISLITVDTGGVNYKDPVIIITGDGFGATAAPTVSGGVITGISVTTGGSNYTTATITIREKFGSGAVITPLFYDQTNSSGAITAVRILDAGTYENVPNCFNVSPINVIGTGNTAQLALDFKLKDVSVLNPGNYYHAVSTSVSGNGTGAILNPIIVDGVIVAINIVSGGTGYTKANLSISGGIGFIGIISFSGTSINAVAVVDGGGGYTSGSTITVFGDGAGANLNVAASGNVKNGVLKTVTVSNGGAGYYYGTTVSCSTSGGVPATLTPTIVNGVIKSISSTGSSGYVPTDLANLTISTGTIPALTTTISGSGKIVGTQLVNDGTGYWAQSEVTPLSLTTGVAGSGALFLPILDSAGSIDRVKVLNGGAGYTGSSTISVTGGGGYNASLALTVFNGRITDVRILNKGYGYKYGTYAIVQGDGTGAVITPVVETGIAHANVVNGGSNYASTTTINVIDPTGTGAVITPTIVNGIITALNIANRGIGYTNPTFTVSNAGSGAGANLALLADRHVSSLIISNAGAGYTYASVLIIGDGSGANYLLQVDSMGALSTVGISNAGTGLTSSPVITITDPSGYGAVSGLTILSGGRGYSKTPIIFLPNKYDISQTLIASGTKFATYGNNIGGVRAVSFRNHGANYHVLPKPIFELNAVLTSPANFIIGEQVRAVSGIYRNSVGSTRLLLDGLAGSLKLENGSYLDYELDDTSYDVGLTATVKVIDYDRNIVELIGVGDTFTLITEDNFDILTEQNIDIVDQSSGTFAVGDILVGMQSGVQGTIGKLNRAIGNSIVGGGGFTEFHFADTVGLLNCADSVIADNHEFQDRAYVVKTGISLNQYEDAIRSTVHQAGFGLFGEVKVQTHLDTNILNEIGNNKILALLYIYSMCVPQYGSEYSTMDDLFGEYNKFKFSLPIDLIKNYTIRQTSRIIFNTIQDYNAPNLFHDELNDWVPVNNLQVTYNTSFDEDGEMTMTRVGDPASSSMSYLYKSFTPNVGDKVSFEFLVKTQVNPLFFPMIRIQDVNGIYVNELRFNTETGAYIQSNATAMDVTVSNLGEFWFIRITAIAQPTTIGATYKLLLDGLTGSLKTESGTILDWEQANVPTNYRAIIYPAAGYTSNMNLLDVAAIGSVELSDVILRNITGKTPFNELISAYNSQYVQTYFNILNTQAEITITP